jgi:putative flippase GtrA
VTGRMIDAFASKQFVGFLLTGGTAAAVNFGSRILLNRWMDYSAAIVVAYLIGMATAFVLARLFVFKQSTQALHRSAGFFVLINVFAIFQTWLVSIILARHLLPALGVNRFVPEIAHAIGVMVPVFSSYLGHKRWSFRQG